MTSERSEAVSWMAGDYIGILYDAILAIINNAPEASRAALRLSMASYDTWDWTWIE